MQDALRNCFDMIAYIWGYNESPSFTMTKKEEVLEFVTRYYLTSRDFNGTPTPEICSSLGVSSDELKGILIALTKQGAVSLVSEAVDVNVHIKRFPKQNRCGCLKRCRNLIVM